MLQRLYVIIVPCVLGIIIAKGSQQDHGNQTRQEDDHHEGVENGKPVYLQKAGAHQHSSRRQVVHSSTRTGRQQQQQQQQQQITDTHLDGQMPSKSPHNQQHLQGLQQDDAEQPSLFVGSGADYVSINSTNLYFLSVGLIRGVNRHNWGTNIQ